MIKSLGKATTEAYELEIPVLGMVYPRGPNQVKIPGDISLEKQDNLEALSEQCKNLAKSLDELEFTPFDRYGTDVPKLFWNPLTFNRDTGQGCFVIKFKPGGVSTPHEHHGFEEFYVLDGEFLDHDGMRYKAGDFVSLGPGVRHYSYSPEGVSVIAWLTDTNRPLVEGETLSFGADVLAKARFQSK